jgi:hypothetical protein
VASIAGGSRGSSHLRVGDRVMAIELIREKHSNHYVVLPDEVEAQLASIPR